jgi:TonB-linked SusC/RagA family outer membrane protein
MKNFLPLLLLLFAIDLSAQKPSNILDKQIKIKPATYKLQEVFDILINDYNLNITYDANTLPMDKSISVTKSESTVKLLFEKLKKNCPIIYQVEGQYIIVKKKKLEEKYKISGVVIDSATSEIMPGATVIIDNTNKGVTADVNGFFSLKLEPGTYKLTFKFIGYNDVEKDVELYDDIELDASLSPEIESIQEVRITKQRNFWGKLDVGRNISTIDNKKVQLLNTNNATDLLQARIPGVWTSQMSGAPGDHQKVRVRGLTSLFACSDPLYVIDGVAVPIVNLRSLGIGDLNVFDIEKVTVLKDAASTAIYGFQGANGVVIVDTKRNNSGKLTFLSKYGIQSLAKRYDLMNTKDFLHNLDSARYFSNAKGYYPPYSDTLKSTDWQDFLFRDGIINEYQLTGAGSILKTNFYISGNYYKHEGIVERSSFKRYNIMVNAGKNITTRISAELIYRGSFQKNFNNLDQYLGNDLILYGINKSPCLNSTPSYYYKTPPVKETSPTDKPDPLRVFYSDASSKALFGDSISTNSLLKWTNNSLNIGSSSLNLTAKMIISENLYVNASSSATFRNDEFGSANNNFSNRSLQNTSFKSNETYKLFNQQLNLNYFKAINNHELIFLVGYRNYTDNATWGLDPIKDENVRIDANTNYFLRNSLAVLDTFGCVTRNINSYSSHLNYNFKRKYFASFVVNYERFDVNRLIEISSIFPSVALSWEISKEPFFYSISWLNQLNVFVNWGKTGNYPINGVAYDAYTMNNYYVNNSTTQGKIITRFANHHLKSEISEEYNLGGSIKILKNRISLNAYYYRKNNSNLMILRDIPYYYMGGKLMYNVGLIYNHGMELNLELNIINNVHLSWSSEFSISFNQQVVKNTGPEKKIMFPSFQALIPSFSVEKGQKLGNILVYKFLGKWDSVPSIYIFPIGKDKFLKIDTINKGKLTDADRVVCGNSVPDYTWHWSNSLQFGNFSLDFLFYGVAGVSKYNATKAATYMAATNRETKKLVAPFRYPLHYLEFYQSSYFVEDASFIKLKQISFSYLIPRKVLKFADIRLTVSLDNVLTFTKYSGYDPEVSIYTDNSFSDFAVDRGAYPIPRSVFFILRVDY